MIYKKSNTYTYPIARHMYGFYFVFVLEIVKITGFWVTMNIDTSSIHFTFTLQVT